MHLVGDLFELYDYARTCKLKYIYISDFIVMYMAGYMFRRPVVILKRLMYTKVKITFGISVTGGQIELPVAVLQNAYQ